jgi:hypothetical protein
VPKSKVAELLLLLMDEQFPDDSGEQRLRRVSQFFERLAALIPDDDKLDELVTEEQVMALLEMPLSDASLN